MLYNYIKDHYKEAEPIFVSDLLRTNINEPDLSQQLKELYEKGLVQQYDEEVYFIPKKTTLNSIVGPNADMVARYRFISKGDNVDGFYTGNTFANQIGISTQVPYVIEIVSNNVSTDGVEYLKKRNVDIPEEESAFDKIDSDNWLYMQEELEEELLTRQVFCTRKS